MKLRHFILLMVGNVCYVALVTVASVTGVIPLFPALPLLIVLLVVLNVAVITIAKKRGGPKGGGSNSRHEGLRGFLLLLLFIGALFGLQLLEDILRRWGSGWRLLGALLIVIWFLSLFVVFGARLVKRIRQTITKPN